MAAKSVWEARSSQLLRARLPYVIKIPDGPVWGGQPRIDFLGMGPDGKFWGVEVKAITGKVPTISFLDALTPGQRNALETIEAAYGTALIFVGHSFKSVSTLYVLPWWLAATYMQTRGKENLQELAAFHTIMSTAVYRPSTWVNPENRVLESWLPSDGSDARSSTSATTK